MNTQYAALLVMSLSAQGCVSAQPIAYSPQPTRIANPKEELKTLILANTTPGCLTDASFSGSMLVVKFVCQAHAGNLVIRFDQIASIELLQSGARYLVRVKHSRGAVDFGWVSRTLEDAQRMDDAITALSKGTSIVATPVPPTT
jgi:hypothetical protein